VVKPIFFVEELFAANAARYDMYFVDIFGVRDKLIVTGESGMALLTLGLLTMKKAHGCALLKLAIKLLMGKRERVRRYLLRLMAEIIA
jgi:hypothetical protein